MTRNFIKICLLVPIETSPKEKFTTFVKKTISSGLKIDSTNKEIMKRLRYHKAVASFATDEFAIAIEDFTEALKFDEKNLLLFLFRAKAYVSLALYDDAIIDLLEVERLNKCEKVSAAVEDMRRTVGQFYVSKSNYEFLEVPRTAIELEISLSFTSLKLLHKVNISKASTDAEKRKIEFKFKRVENAFAILSDKKFKKQYDKHLADEEAKLESAMRRRECYNNCFGCLGGFCTSVSNCCEYRDVQDGLSSAFMLLLLFGMIAGIVYFIWWSIGLWMIWPATFVLLFSCCYCCKKLDSEF